jgi:hypothetical protein
MATAELDQVWRPSLGTRVGAGLLSAVGVALAVSGVVVAAGGDWTGGLAVMVVFGLFPVFGWRWGTHPLLATSDDGVTVRNPVRSAVVPWDEVGRCAPTSLGLAIERVDGRPVVAWAVQKPNVARWLRRRTRADEVAETIVARAAALRPPPEPDGTEPNGAEPDGAEPDDADRS